MRTSETIKGNQAQPPEILHRSGQRWKVEGREKPWYWVTRSDDGRTFYCACRSRRRPSLCRHVQAVILDLATPKNVVEVSFWTHRQDAERQHRRVLELNAKRKPFWVTYDYPGDIPREKGSRLTHLREDIHGNVDAWYLKAGGWTWRQMVRREFVPG